MKILTAILFATLAIGVQAQTGVTTVVPGDGTTVQKTITCGPYQHNQHTPAHCANNGCITNDSWVCTTSCQYVPAEDKCVDDLHWVTEAEWQALMKRLADLEHPGNGDPHCWELKVSNGKWQEISCGTLPQKAPTPCDAKHPQFCISGRYIP